jgi:hypothetical protein
LVADASQLARELVDYDVDVAARVLEQLRAELADDGGTATTREWKSGFGHRERVRALAAELQTRLGQR